MKVLHISFHKGCQNDIEYVAKKLGWDLSFMEYDDGISIGNDKYNVTKEKALSAWKKYKNFYDQHDIIITSDTTPISRVFLQNDWGKKLIIWICNRIDYSHQPSVEFPDGEYYELIKNAKSNPNVIIIGYTLFENYYANNIKNLQIGSDCIKPIGQIEETYKNFISTKINNKEKTFFIGPYHNDNIMINLKDKVESLGFSAYNGRYNGPLDLAEFAAVIHIPYAWSNLALFEAIQLQIIYFIPTLKFIKSLKNTGMFFWSPPYIEDKLELSEWYCLEHKNTFVYFDSWNDLELKLQNTDFQKQKEVLKKFGEEHEQIMLEKWKNIINRIH